MLFKIITNGMGFPKNYIVFEQNNVKTSKCLGVFLCDKQVKSNYVIWYTIITSEF